ncbi:MULTISPECIES: phosphatidate cytidylyltransferase [unclassified Thioalkalivibrio]|uniref:phosphatidate cytidylyltransferase n=1 Tax=unclassified Thioalkalivibrio TaxID=2621013 RepID=UPI0003656CC3|nr:MULTISPECIES: phosphatidate cytidylyltransferase [unclassified Thioalkalivibrio]
MLRQRILTASALGLPALALVAWGPNWAVLLLVVLVLGLATWEWGGLAGLVGHGARAALVAAVGAPVLALGTAPAGALHYLILGLALLWWLVILLVLPFYREHEEGARGRHGPLFAVAAILTLVPAGMGLVWLHALAPLLVVYLVVLVGLADTGAYFAGKAFGRNPLAPHISPGKTREGLFGGLLTVLAFATVVAIGWGLAPMDALVFLLLSVLIGLVSVVGDLFESILKREAGSKDSGSLLPGHGGILDRFDSMVAAAPVFLAGLLWLALIPASPVTG